MKKLMLLLSLSSFTIIGPHQPKSAKAVAMGVPQEESWRVGFGLMVSVVWLYLEVLRLLSILRRD